MPGDPTAHVDVLHFGPSVAAVAGVNTRSFQSVKSTSFGNHDKWARELAFHYTVFADAYDFYPDNVSPLTGAVASLSADGFTLTASGTPFTGHTSDALHGMVMLDHQRSGQGSHEHDRQPKPPTTP